ncbi:MULTISPECIES: branched-chain amino acid ABC transporter permease [Marinobacter]|jgi:branched-chain amino acid transport system permease protein|uniref:High-affinity branched-chain amino acid transport system permease protein LivH n=2 Tax=Marinobacter TaxID=2742 RepID=A0A1W6KEI9_9GAMM|nr:MULTISPECIES: branched-chain amino acid ABC transporter permease [Marinobacter]MBL83449.1 branched-chain amino acid ABC transporter permease [Marinobacter sp.]ARM85840.1 high-affinity branched-chain amino acid transport system permease protein LivH [Marinobacter salarius]MBJ7275666.1 branched-chain amino acid ABC transporter permease [Marinobacter salarius]MBJ7299100.1 branched-chain amino acid ABC transporter permease [Marinobacter salarius]MBS8232139.1 branched-chain amino acid ABC transp|tara:strand:- start:190 stop:1068 length:879 start_codon:yes stop_codon:yes gene_type:complete
MDWLFFGEISLAGLAMGGLYALIALGFVIIYKATRVINFAIGEIMMFAAYLFLAFAGGMELSPWIALPLAVIGGSILGGVIEKTMIRPMLGESPISVVMVTIGIGSILVGLVEFIWTADPQLLPRFLPREPVFIGPLYLAPKIAYGFLIGSALLIIYLLYFRFSRGGVALRATASDQAAAYSMGINVRRVFNMAWVFGSLAASLAGVLVAATGGLSPQFGIIGLSVLVVVIVGGLDSILGALVAGVFIGWLETVAGAYLGGEYRMPATFLVLAVILVIRPYGLFGTHEIERV